MIIEDETLSPVDLVCLALTCKYMLQYMPCRRLFLSAGIGTVPPWSDGLTLGPTCTIAPFSAVAVLEADLMNRLRGSIFPDSLAVCPSCYMLVPITRDPWGLTPRARFVRLFDFMMILRFEMGFRLFTHQSWLLGFVKSNFAMDCIEEWITQPGRRFCPGCRSVKWSTTDEYRGFWTRSWETRRMRFHQV